MTYHFNETQAQLESLFLKSLSTFRIYKYVQVQVMSVVKRAVLTHLTLVGNINSHHRDVMLTSVNIFTLDIH